MRTEELWSLLLGLEPFDPEMVYMHLCSGTQLWPHPVIGVLMSAVEGLSEVPMQDVAVVCVIFVSLCRSVSAQFMGPG